MAPFDRSHTSSYSPSIVTMAISCIVCARLIGRKSWNFYAPPVFSVPAGGYLVGISWRCLMLVKLVWLGYRMVMVKKNYDDMLSRFHLIPACHRQTDRIVIWISRVNVLTRDKNRWLRIRVCSPMGEAGYEATSSQKSNTQVCYHDITPFYLSS